MHYGPRIVPPYLYLCLSVGSVGKTNQIGLCILAVFEKTLMLFSFVRRVNLYAYQTSPIARIFRTTLTRAIEYRASKLYWRDMRSM